MKFEHAEGGRVREPGRWGSWLVLDGSQGTEEGTERLLRCWEMVSSMLVRERRRKSKVPRALARVLGRGSRG